MPFAAQFEFQFSQRGHDGRHGPPGRGGGVHPFPLGAQQDSALTEFRYGAGHLGDRAAEPVDGGDNNRVAGAGIN